MTVHATLTSPASGATEQPVSGNLEFTISGLPGDRSIGIFVDIGEGFTSSGGSYTTDGDKSKAYSTITPRTGVAWYAQERDFPSGANPENGPTNTFTIVQYAANFGGLFVTFHSFFPSSTFPNANPVFFIASAGFDGVSFPPDDYIALLDGVLSIDDGNIISALSVSGVEFESEGGIGVLNESHVVSEGEHTAVISLAGNRWLNGEEGDLITDVYTRSFTALAPRPNKPITPFPTDTDTGVILQPTLSWEVG